MARVHRCTKIEHSATTKALSTVLLVALAAAHAATVASPMRMIIPAVNSPTDDGAARGGVFAPMRGATPGRISDATSRAPFGGTQLLRTVAGGTERASGTAHHVRLSYHSSPPNLLVGSCEQKQGDSRVGGGWILDVSRGRRDLRPISSYE
eukprot:4023090-Prymnesium_polylepis.2